MSRLINLLVEEIGNLRQDYDVRGIVDPWGGVYPLSADTKVLSTIFELVSRPAIFAAAARMGYEVVEASVQNHYPDFTLMREPGDRSKIAVDVKTTYRRNQGGKFSYTLGGYTSFMRQGNETKNIVYPFDEYARHLVIGFVYDRVREKRISIEHKYTLKQLDDIPRPFENVDFFVNEKWRVASDRAGSGNTTNIGSIHGTIEDFRQGSGPFWSEQEFLEYWRGYGRTASTRTDYSDIDGFRRFKQGR